MPPFVINHMTTPGLAWRELLGLSRDLGCIGVEFRNDLPTPLFSGDAPEMVAAETHAQGQRIVGLSQVYPFNAWDDARAEAVEALIETARACGAETISLIPLNDGTGQDETTRRTALRRALGEIAPMLDGTGIIALVEPLGFERASLRSKAETIEAIEAVASRDKFRIVHDTFHHFLAGGGPLFADWTGIVHISGVDDPDVTVAQMEDAHRVLVSDTDRLGNIEQIRALLSEGYDGPLSFECFSPAIHRLADPAAAIRQSITHITTRL